MPTRETLERVRAIIKPFIHRTPVLTSTMLDKMFGGGLYFKCENFQKGGAFKFRGATHAVMGLTDEQASKGVATHSSGNHAQALALAARMRGVQAHIVMPDTAPAIKVNAVKDYGGIVTFCVPTLEAREATLAQVINRTRAIEIHPYNDYRIISGQASAAAELIEETPSLDYIIAPVGGGGLLSGTILTASFISPSTKIIGGEPKNADDARRSFIEKKFIPSENPETIADGLRTSLGSLTYPIIMDGVHDILTVSEEAIIKAMFLLWERMKIVVEPSGAVPLAVIMEHRELFQGKNTGLILSGGNTDLNKLPWMGNMIFSKQ